MRKKTVIFTIALAAVFGTMVLTAQSYMQKTGHEYHAVSYVYENFETDPASSFDLKYSQYGISNKIVMKLYDSTPAGLGEWKGESKKSLGINAEFARKGFNWIDLIPKGFKPFEGKVQNLSCWIWGAGFAWNADFVVEDYMGFQWALPAGSVQYYGWRNLNVYVPSSIPQQEPYIPHRRGLSLKKLRINANPNEIASRFHIFFDYFKVVTDTYQGIYDGIDLEATLKNELYGDLYKNSSQSSNKGK